MWDADNVSNFEVDFLANEDGDESDDNDGEPLFARREFVLLVLLALYVSTLAANLGLVHYESEVADVYRTLLNRMVSTCSVYNAAAASLALMPIALKRLEFVSFGSGATEEAACYALSFVGLFLCMQIVMAHNEIAILRYLYICR